MTLPRSRFIFFTKTHWNEPPRLRHQLAELVASAGHDVLFFEKPSNAWQAPCTAKQRSSRITTVQHRELLHHKLRLIPALHQANAKVAINSIRSRLRESFGEDSADTIVSFNYDYWFLRKVFPRNNLITVINDDFVCVALFGYTKPLLWALDRTCAASHRVLTVSLPLMKQLAPYCEPELFLPWADKQYQAPARSERRDTLLFWGYINRRFDFDGISALADRLRETRPEIRLLFVGPINGAAKHARALQARPNVEFAPPSALDELPLDRVLAAYIPYRANDLEIDAITLSNKALQLLSRALPLLISSRPAMPNFLEAPFVMRVDLANAGVQIDNLRSTFDALQPAIMRFVMDNGPEARLRQLMYETPDLRMKR